MTSFHALNIDYDEESDVEIDNTKEIQIEDSIKDYQTALKFHSQGPASLKEAEKAYDTLFQSDIFKYPESQSEYKRAQALASDGGYVADFVYSQTEAAQNENETARGTLPQLLHLSYKNRGQFRLDQIKSLLKEKQTNGVTENKEADFSIRNIAKTAISDFAEALDKDDEDVDLWRRAARVGDSLGSKRISRFCLEAALEGDVEGTDDILGGPSIEAIVAGQNLHQLEDDLQDDLSFVKPNLKIPTKQPPPILLKSLDLYTYLPSLQTEQHGLLDETRLVEHISVPELSRASFVRAILDRIVAEQEGEAMFPPNGMLHFDLENALSMSPVLNRRKSSALFAKPQLTAADATSATPNIKSEGNGDAPDGVDAPTDGGSADVKSPTDAPPSTPLPTRKRSMAQAEIPESEGGRGRSKRIRARESMADGAVTDAAGNKYTPTEWQLFYPIEADRILFNMLHGLASKIGIKTFESAHGLRRLVTGDGILTEATAKAEGHKLLPAMKTFYQSMLTWTKQKNAILNATSKGGEKAIDSRNAGLTAFLDSTTSKEERPVDRSGEGVYVRRIVESMNEEWLSPQRAGMRCIWDMVSGADTSEYLALTWSEDLKITVDELLVCIDHELYSLFTTSAEEFLGQPDSLSEASLPRFKEVVFASQAMFEMHLDLYMRLTSPASDADPKVRQEQRIRLSRWCLLAREIISFYCNASDVGMEDDVVLRHIWSTVFDLRALEDIDREHVLACIQNLRETLSAEEKRIVKLPNCLSFPEISVTAADRELSKLKTMDFFLNIFTEGDQDPVSLIERLEPILYSEDSQGIEDPVKIEEDDNAVEDDQEQDGEAEVAHAQPSTFKVLCQFVTNASDTLRLSLWKRLRDAYKSIDYPPKVLTIELRSMKLILDDLIAAPLAAMRTEDRETKLLSSMRDCQEPLDNVLKIIETSDDAFQCVDLGELTKALDTLSNLWMILHSVALFDDYAEVNVKEKQMMNPFRAYPTEAFHSASIRFHDMQVRTMMVWYHLLRESTSQLPKLFTPSESIQLDYLRHSHHALGMRRLCKASDSLYLRFMKTQLEKLTKLEVSCGDEYSQVLYDLFDLNCFASAQEKQDHGCEPDYLDRATAMELVDFVFDKAKNVNVKDWLKSEIVKSVEKLNHALGPIRASYAIARNRKIYATFLKSPMHPLELYRSLEGLNDLSAVPTSKEEAPLAAKGWFFLRGQIAMTKYRAQRAKGTQVSDEDLQEATTLFSQDLEFSPERWESWFGLAQAYDAQIEEKVLWSAEDLNGKRSDLAQLERSSIHSYCMAISMAVRGAEPSGETKIKLADLYSSFGTRIYASSRPPFSMTVFSLEDFGEKYCSGEVAGGGLYTRRPFKPIRQSKAWRFAARLFRMAILMNPNVWMNHYMLGKCLWKLRQKKDGQASGQDAIKEYMNALDNLPDRKERSQDPILEPIYKAISAIDKLTRNKQMDEMEAASSVKALLERQSQFDANKTITLEEAGDWLSYMLDIMKMLRSADKAKWHHRVVMKSAHILFDKKNEGHHGAKAAKDYLIDQHLYSTKTLTLTVWKPENERPGRHWAFMTAYCKFLATLLEESDDVEGMQMLIRRVRKKANDFYEHAQLWEHVCMAHLRLQRRQGEIVEGLDTKIFEGMAAEDFAPKAAQVDAWCQDPANTHKWLDVMREVAEIKKINLSLMPAAPMDALLAETYATIYSEIGPTLGSPPPAPATSATAPTANTAPTATAGTGPATAASTPGPPDLSHLGSAAPSKLPPTPERINIMSLMNLDGSPEDRPSAAAAVTQAATTSAPPTLTEPAPRPRFKPVTRRELAKRATENSMQRIAAMPVPSKARQSEAGTRPTSMAANSRSSAAKQGSEDGGEDISGEKTARENDSAVASAAASVRGDDDDDNDDDESELTEPPGDGEEDEDDHEDDGAAKEGDADAMDVDGPRAANAAAKINAQRRISRPIFPNLSITRADEDQHMQESSAVQTEDEADEDEGQASLEASQRNDDDEEDDRNREAMEDAKEDLVRDEEPKEEPPSSP